MERQLFEEIYQQYKPFIYNYLYRSTLNHHTAEELTQDTFLKAFSSIRRFRKASSLKTWLFTIARNTYLDYLKKRSTRAECADADAGHWPDRSDPYSALAEHMLIRQIMLKLSEKGRTLLILRDQYAFTYREIAQITGLTEGQVKIGLYRARKAFKTIYQRESEVERT